MREKSRFIVVGLISVLAIACEAKKAPAVDTAPGTTVSVPTPPPASASPGSVYVDNGGTKVAFFVGFATKMGRAHLYIPSVDRYASVNLATGDYDKAELYYPQLGCIGDPVADASFGEVGKTVIHQNGKFYLLKTPVADGFIVRSVRSYDGICTPAGPFTLQYAAAYTTEEVSRPYDFAGIAPLSLKYE